jgi:cytosine deaminase
LGVDFRIEEGAPANGVLLYARDPIEALRLKAQRGLVLSQGQIVAQSPHSTVQLTLPNQPASTISFLEGPHYGF